MNTARARKLRGTLIGLVAAAGLMVAGCSSSSGSEGVSLPSASSGISAAASSASSVSASSSSDTSSAVPSAPASAGSTSSSAPPTSASASAHGTTSKAGASKTKSKSTTATPSSSKHTQRGGTTRPTSGTNTTSKQPPTSSVPSVPVHEPPAATDDPTTPVYVPPATTEDPSTSAPQPVTSHTPVVTTQRFTKDVAVAQPATKRINDSSMYEGTSKTVQSGHAGKVRITYEQTYVDGAKSGSPREVGRTTITEAIPTIVHVGTKARPDEVTYKTYTENSTIKQPADKHVDDPTMYVGESKVVTQGHPGTLQTTYKQKYVNGKKSGSPVKVGTKTIKQAVATVIHDGTKVKTVPWHLDAGLASSTVSAVNAWRTAHGLGALGGTDYPCSPSDAKTYAESEGSSGGCGMDAWGYPSGSSAVNAWVSANDQHTVTMNDAHISTISCVAYSKADGTGASISCVFGGFA